MTAKGLFEIEDLAGHLYFGPLETVPEKGLQVATASRDRDRAPPHHRPPHGHQGRASGSRLWAPSTWAAGYTKSSDLAQFNGDVTVKYARPTFSAELNASSFIQRQTEVRRHHPQLALPQLHSQP